MNTTPHESPRLSRSATGVRLYDYAASGTCDDA
jgi:hypothetical protein